MNHDKGISSYRDLPIELIKDMRDAVIRKLSELTGKTIESSCSMLDKPRPHGPPETKPLIDQYDKLSLEIYVYNQRRRNAHINKIAFGKEDKLAD